MTYNLLRIFICFFLFIFARTSLADEVAKIIAMVNNEVITSQDLASYISFLKYKNPELKIDDELRRDVLQRLIEDKMILSLAKEEVKEVPQRWLTQKMEELISSYPSREAFEESLVKEGVTVTMLKEKLKIQYLTQNIVEREVRSGIEITPQEITEYYNQNKLDFIVPRECVLWVGKSQDKAPLEELALSLADTPITEATAGQYGVNRLEVKESSLKPEIKEVVRGLSSGENAVKEINGMFYFVYVEKISPFKMISLDEAKENIYAFLWERKYKKAFSEWLDSHKQKALIKIYE